MGSAGADVLSDVLRALQLRATVYFHAHFAPPWGMEIPQGAVANFHFVSEGECWFRVRGAAPVPLRRGDILVVPRGAPHSLLDSRTARGQPARQLLDAPSSKDPLVFGGGGQASVKMLCGHFELDADAPIPLLASLPEWIHLERGRDDDASWTENAMALAATESRSGKPGAGVIVDRLAEALLAQVIRTYVAEQSSLAPGVLAGLADPLVYRTLSTLHGGIRERWTVESLARAVGSSRSALAGRFKRALGLPPMEYLRMWRLQRARELLQDESRTIAWVASRVGYESEWAFAKAFKRVFGMGPGRVRRESRGVPSPPEPARGRIARTRTRRES